MKRREITEEDITYENGFPANIDPGKTFVIQISTGPTQSVVLYTCIVSGLQLRCYLPLVFGSQYISGIYMFVF